MDNLAAVITEKIAKPNNQWHLQHDEANTLDIINLILACDRNVAADTTAAAGVMRGSNVYETCSNIHSVITKYIRYQEDEFGYQKLKSPAQLWQSKVGDCKSFSLFGASVLRNLGIPYRYRFISTDANRDVHHVYLVVQDENGKEICLDATRPTFDREPPHAYKQDYIINPKLKMKYGNRSSNRTTAPDAEGNRSVNGIGGLKERAHQKGLDNLYNELTKKDFSVYFTYLFFPEFSAIEMPRLVVRKVMDQLTLYYGIYTAFYGDDQVTVGSFGKSVNYLKYMIDSYFSNAKAIETNPQPGQPAGIQWGDYVPDINTPNVYAFTPNVQIFPTNENKLPPQFSAGMSAYINNGWLTVSPESITKYYGLLFNAFIKSNDITETFRKAFFDKTGQTPVQYLTEKLDDTAERGWLQSYEFAYLDLERAQLPIDMSEADCNKAYYFDAILTTVDGKSALKMHTPTISIPGLKVGAKLLLAYLSTNNAGYAENGANVFRIDHANNTVILDKKLVDASAQEKDGMGLFKFNCVTPTVDNTNADLILWLDVPGYQRPLFSEAAVTRFSESRVVFLRVAYYTKVDLIRLTPKQENTGEGARILEIQGQVNINGRIGYILNRSKYDDLAGSKMLAAIHATPQAAGNILGYAKEITYNRNGTFNITRYNNGTAKFDPDGVMPGYTTLNVGQYVNTTGIGYIPIAELVTIISTIVSILATLSGIIINIVAAMKANDLILGDPRPEADFRLDKCKYTDNTYKTLSCLQDDGTWKCFDLNYQYLGVDCKPQDESGTQLAGFGMLGAGLLALVALPMLFGGKEKKRKK